MNITKGISTYRSQIMGGAILWIMMLHFTFTQVKPLGFIAQYGFAGVEIFIMVSGFGLFFSLDKDASLTHFYKKRLLRIFPTYYIIGALWSIFIFHDNLWQYLFRFSTIGFWTGCIYGEWFIPSIVVLYLAAPWLKQLFDRRLFSVLVAIATGFLGLALYFVDKEQVVDRSHFFLLYRVPSFIFGMACAYWLKHGVSDKYYYALMLCGLPLFVSMFPHHHQVFGYKYLSLIFLLPLFVCCFTLLLKYARLLHPLTGLMGKASLEIYLIQGIFFSAIIRGMLPMPALWHDALAIVLIIVSTFAGIFLHWLIEKSSTGIRNTNIS